VGVVVAAAGVTAARAVVRAGVVGAERDPSADRTPRVASAVRTGLAHQATVNTSIVSFFDYYIYVISKVFR
jgi:hypothetical protein